MRTQQGSMLAPPVEAPLNKMQVIPTLDSSLDDTQIAETSSWQNEEQLIVDDRADTRPAQMVEDKLTGLLKGDFMMVSQLRLKRLIATRR